MPTIYQSRAGALIRQSIPAASALVQIDGLDDTLSQGTLLACSLKLDRSQDVQYQKTLSETIYAYAFGEGIGRFQLGGYVFFADCSSAGINSAITDVNDYYDQNNVHEREDPVAIAIGGVAFSTYLEVLSVNVDDNPFNFGVFNLLFSVLPPGQ